jgi:hypothetical protein
MIEDTDVRVAGALRGDMDTDVRTGICLSLKYWDQLSGCVPFFPVPGPPETQHTSYTTTHLLYNHNVTF